MKDAAFDKGLISTEEIPEKAVLVGIDRGKSEWDVDSSLAELERLAYTAGVEVVAKTSQKLTAPNPATFIGSGKAVEIADLVRSLDADVVIFDDELSPSQQSNLERIVDRNVKIIDRTALILDIFALHAKTKEGRLQVRLAQNQYLYPRLRGMWAHLASNRMGGGVGSRFGEGESQLEVDRRMVRKRITSIKRELSNLEKRRDLQRMSRKNSGIFKIALAGYTNAGKSSLLNGLCESQVYSDDLLFATLDSTTRKLTLPEGREVTLSDTVGFIQKLPTTLIEAFKSTLSEVSGSDLILHVIDASSDNFEAQINTVEEIFEQIGVNHIPQIYIFNKIDILEDEKISGLRRRFPEAVFVSALRKSGFEDLIKRLSMSASASDVTISVQIPFSRGDVKSFVHKYCTILSEEYDEDGIRMTLRVPIVLLDKLKDYSI